MSDFANPTREDFEGFNDSPNLLDELHPCCQKELDENTRNAKVKAELRKFDRSNIRLDEHRNTFVDLKKELKCQCCESSLDYSALQLIRFDLTEIDENRSEDNEGEEENESDDDLNFEDDFTLNLQSSSLDALKRAYETRKQAEALGFAVHVEDSSKHFLKLIETLRCPFVLHIYDENSPLCARIDLVLENLALRYLGNFSPFP